MSYPIGRESSVGPESGELLVAAVLSFVGGSGSLDMRDKAIVFINQAIRDMTARGVSVHQVKDLETTGFTNGQESIPLPDDWQSPYGQAYLKNTDGKISKYLEWRSWDNFSALRVDRTSANYVTPDVLSIRSPHIDDAVYFYPPISSTYSAYTVVIPYVARIQGINESDTLKLSPQMRQAIIEGGKAYFMQFLNQEIPQIWRPYFEIFYQTCELLVQEGAQQISEAQNLGFHFAADGDEALLELPKLFIPV